MKYTLPFTIIILLLSFATLAQTTADTTEMESDRPNFTQGVSVVPSQTIQVETGVEFRRNNTGNDQEKDFDYPTALIRIGVLKNAELRLNFELAEERHFDQSDTSFPKLKTKEKGFNDVQIGAKVALLEGEHGPLPDVGILGIVTLPVGNKAFRPPHAAPEVQLLFDNQINKKLELQYNVGYRKHRNNEEYRKELLYSAAITWQPIHDLKLYTEFQALKPVQTSPENTVNAGVMYKLLPNLQVDAYAGTGVSEAAPDFYTGAGITWRIPH